MVTILSGIFRWLFPFMLSVPVFLEFYLPNELECVWCDGRVHTKCAKISEELSIMLGNASNCMFFCDTCLHTLPIALKFYNDLSPLDARITVQKSITEMQSTANQLSTVNNKVHRFSKQHQEVANQISNLTERIKQLVIRAVRIIILNGLLDRTSTATTSIPSGLGKILLGILMSITSMTPPPWDDWPLR